MLINVIVFVYCILTYAFGYRFFTSRFPQRIAIFLWLFSPYSYLATLLAEWLVGGPDALFPKE